MKRHPLRYLRLEAGYYQANIHLGPDDATVTIKREGRNWRTAITMPNSPDFDHAEFMHPDDWRLPTLTQSKNAVNDWIGGYMSGLTGDEFTPVHSFTLPDTLPKNATWERINGADVRIGDVIVVDDEAVTAGTADYRRHGAFTVWNVTRTAATAGLVHIKTIEETSTGMHSLTGTTDSEILRWAR